MSHDGKQRSLVFFNSLLLHVDGSNVAMSHGNKEKFSCLGIKICVQWFQARGHKVRLRRLAALR
jgi:hypothetical protein